MLVNMLVTNAMVFLGQMPAPGSQQYMRNLPQAQHMVDLLMVLREKTRGNLTPDEDQMMQDLLPNCKWRTSAPAGKSARRTRPWVGYRHFPRQ